MERWFQLVPAGSSLYCYGANYTVRKLSNKKHYSIFTILLLTLSTLNIVVYGTTLEVETNKDEYLVGESIVISCTAAPSETVNILVKEGEQVVFDTTVVVDEDGRYREGRIPATRD